MDDALAGRRASPTCQACRTRALVLAAVAQRFDLALAPGQRIDTGALITLNPKHGMSMIPQGRK